MLSAIPPAGLLRLRRLPFDTCREPVAYLSPRSAVCRLHQHRPFERIEIASGGQRIVVTVDVIDHDGILGPGEIGLSHQGFSLLGLPEGAEVEVSRARSPDSMHAVRRKIRGEEFAEGDLRSIIRDISALRYTRIEIAAFLISCAGFMSTDEVMSLTRAMVAAGRHLDWPGELIVDTHCVGGIPGNRTSMIVVPIVAAHGLTIPRICSRAVTSSAGTADAMEVLARVDLDLEEMRAVVTAESGCLVWGGRVDLSPADDAMTSVDRPLAIDTREQLVASIISKKLCAGASHLLIDLPVGATARLRDQQEAVRLRKLFEHVGDQLGLVVDVHCSDGSQPVGRGIGPALEARDVMRVLHNDPGAPSDLRDRAILLAGRILELDPGVRGGAGAVRARELLRSGAALAKMERIIDAQGRVPDMPAPAALHQDIVATGAGFVAAIDCRAISRIARLAGAPADKGAGIDLFKKAGDPVEVGEPLYRIHADLSSDLALAAAQAADSPGYGIASVPR